MSSPVAVCFKVNPVSATCVSFISWSSPKFTTAPSAKNKSENSNAEVPRDIPSEDEGAIAPVVIVALSVPPTLISIWSSVSAVIVVSPSASKTNSLPSKSRDPPNPASTRFVPSE